MLIKYDHMISGFYCEVAENCTLLGYYAAPTGNIHHSLCNNPEEHSSQVWPTVEGINKSAWIGTNLKLDRHQDTMNI